MKSIFVGEYACVDVWMFECVSVFKRRENELWWIGAQFTVDQIIIKLK